MKNSKNIPVGIELHITYSDGFNIINGLSIVNAKFIIEFLQIFDINNYGNTIDIEDLSYDDYIKIFKHVNGLFKKYPDFNYLTKPSTFDTEEDLFDYINNLASKLGCGSEDCLYTCYESVIAYEINQINLFTD